MGCGYFSNKTHRPRELTLDKDHTPIYYRSMKTNKQTGELKVINDVKDEPSLEQAQAFVGGYVEGISFPNGDYLIINEEGKLKGLPFNVPASKLWKDTFDNDNYMTGRDDYVVGNAILIKKAALKDWAA